MKQIGPARALVLNSTSEQIYECSDDLARLMLVLFASDATEARSFTEIHAELCACSESYRENTQGAELLSQALTKLQEANFLETLPPAGAT